MLRIKFNVNSFLGGNIQELREDVKNQAFTCMNIPWVLCYLIVFISRVYIEESN